MSVTAELQCSQLKRDFTLTATVVEAADEHPSGNKGSVELDMGSHFVGLAIILGQYNKDQSGKCHGMMRVVR